MLNNFIDIQVPDSFNPEKYKGKNILIIGGGPTTNLVKWENINLIIP